MEVRNWNLYRPCLDDFDFWKCNCYYQITGYAKWFAFCFIFSATHSYLITTGNKYFPYEFYVLFRWMWLFNVLLLLSNNKSFLLFYISITYCYLTTAGTYQNAFCMKVNINFIVQMSVSFCQACFVPTIMNSDNSLCKSEYNPGLINVFC